MWKLSPVVNMGVLWKVKYLSYQIFLWNMIIMGCFVGRGVRGFWSSWGWFCYAACECEDRLYQGERGNAGMRKHLREVVLTFTVNDGVSDFLASLNMVKPELSLLDVCMISSQTYT